jgi:hypothetical protein
MDKVWSYIGKVFSDGDQPSSSRITSTWLSISSMALIWFIVRHAMYLTSDKLQMWLANLPLIIAALGTFSTAPYGIAKITSAFSKVGAKVAEIEQKPQ